MNRASWVFALALMLLRQTTVSSPAATVEFAITDPATGKTLLKGEEYVRPDGADIVKRTVYRTLAGQDAEAEDVRYDAASLKLDHYRFEDKVTGEHQFAERGTKPVRQGQGR